MPPSFFLLEMRMCGCFVRAIWINYNFDPEEPETNNNNKKKKAWIGGDCLHGEVLPHVKFQLGLDVVAKLSVSH